MFVFLFLFFKKKESKQCLGRYVSPSFRSRRRDYILKIVRDVCRYRTVWGSGCCQATHINLIQSNNLPTGGWNHSQIHCSLIHKSVCGEKALEGDWTKLKFVTFRLVKSAEGWHLMLGTASWWSCKNTFKNIFKDDTVALEIMHSFEAFHFCLKWKFRYKNLRFLLTSV